LGHQVNLFVGGIAEGNDSDVILEREGAHNLLGDFLLHVDSPSGVAGLGGRVEQNDDVFLSNGGARVEGTLSRSVSGRAVPRRLRVHSKEVIRIREVLIQDLLARVVVVLQPLRAHERELTRLVSDVSVSGVVLANPFFGLDMAVL